MKKKLVSVMIAALGISLLAGCGKESEAEQESERHSRREEREEEEEEEEEWEDEPGQNVEAEVVLEPQADNNGGNFIGVDGMVYFRQYSNYGLEGVSNLRFFLYPGPGGYESSICCLDPADPENFYVVAPDEGTGGLYYYDGYLYSYRYDWTDGMLAPVTYRTELSSGNTEDLGGGRIIGASYDGSVIVTEEYDQNVPEYIYTVYDAGEDCTAYVCEADYGTSMVNFIAADTESIYLLVQNEITCDSTILQHDFRTGFEYDLSMIFAPDEGIEEYLTYAEPKDAFVIEDILYFNCCYCVGVDHMIENAYSVVVPVCTDRGVEYDGQVSIADYELNESIIGTSTYDQEYGSNFASMEVMNTREDGFARAVQTVDNVYGTDYAILANCYYAPYWNQGQNENYELMSLDYYYADGNSAPVLFNEGNPTDQSLIVKAWFIGEQGSEPEGLLFQYADINGPEGPFDTDPMLYVAEFSDDFVFVHVPEGGDIYDRETYEFDGMDYLTEYLAEDIYDPFVAELTPDEEYNYEAPVTTEYSFTPAFLHIHMNREGQINYMRFVVFD